MFNRTIPFLGLLVILFSGCNQHHGADANASHESGHERHDHQTHETPDPASMQLNQGQKWQMDTHTRTVTAKMTTTLQNADLTSLTDAERQRLGADLKADVDTLIQGCTMTGDAHDQLHLFLANYIPAVESLASVGSPADAQQVQRLMASYGEFFE